MMPSDLFHHLTDTAGERGGGSLTSSHGMEISTPGRNPDRSSPNCIVMATVMSTMGTYAKRPTPSAIQRGAVAVTHSIPNVASTGIVTDIPVRMRAVRAGCGTSRAVAETKKAVLRTNVTAAAHRQ